MAKTAQCSSCGTPMHTTGPAPADGQRFCSLNACHAAYLRRRRAKINGIDAARMEDRPCTFCGDPLPKRFWRVTDLEVGRWCERNRCRRDKHVVLAQMAADGALGAPGPDLDERNSNDLWMIANFGDAEETVCATCDRTDARVGYYHPAPETLEPCNGTGYVFFPELLPQMRELWTKKA